MCKHSIHTRKNQPEGSQFQPAPPRLMILEIKNHRSVERKIFPCLFEPEGPQHLTEKCGVLMLKHTCAAPFG